MDQTKAQTGSRAQKHEEKARHFIYRELSYGYVTARLSDLTGVGRYAYPKIAGRAVWVGEPSLNNAEL